MKSVQIKTDYYISSKFRTFNEYRDFRYEHASIGQRVRILIGLNRIDRRNRSHLMKLFPYYTQKYAELYNKNT